MRCSAHLSFSRTLSPSPIPSSFASCVSRRLQLGFSGRAAAVASNWKCLRRTYFRSAALSPSPVPSGERGPVDTEDYVVVNFYSFVFVQDPQELLAQHISFMEGLDIHGRIYLNEQGINAQYSGPKKDAFAYVDFVKEDQRFSDILVQTSPTLYGCHVFPRLKLRYKPSLVQVVGNISQLSLLDSAKRATPLTPSQWRIRLEAINNVNNLSNVDINRKCIILDVRNGYEWDIGHFQGAQRPNVDCFKSTSFGLSESEVLAFDPLAAVDKDKTDILMYCTGGIRCDMYSTLLRGKGFERLYTLKGGVSHYLKVEGSSGWIGNLFVFDSRLSLPPSSYNPEAEIQRDGVEEASSQHKAFARCYICGSHITELRHCNCANVDCNHLFLSSKMGSMTLLLERKEKILHKSFILLRCMNLDTMIGITMFAHWLKTIYRKLCCTECSANLRGCCCLNCTTAPRLRPSLPIRGHQNYEKWHHYRDLIEVQCIS